MSNVRTLTAAGIFASLLSAAPVSASDSLIGMPAEKAIEQLSSAGFVCGGLILETPGGARTGCISATPAEPVTISMALDDQKRVLFLIVNGTRIESPGKAYLA